MERGNSKHGARLDDAMEHEVRGILQGGASPRVDEWHDPEPSGEDQPEAGRVPGGTVVGGSPPGMTADEVEGRSNLGRYVPKSALPGDRTRLLDGARALAAPDAVLGQLARLPEGREYATVSEVWAALGHHNEAHRT